MKLTFDWAFQERDVVIVCPCGWRGVALSRRQAHDLARRHRQFAHRSDTEMRDQVRSLLDAVHRREAC